MSFLGSDGKRMVGRTPTEQVCGCDGMDQGISSLMWTRLSESPRPNVRKHFNPSDRKEYRPVRFPATLVRDQKACIKITESLDFNHNFVAKLTCIYFDDDYNFSLLAIFSRRQLCPTGRTNQTACLPAWPGSSYGSTG